ncbi:nudix hydrolase 17, mitochondrial-like isoform X1 [Primulina tabacum]|uniref:nudix hydrolase 17, mitochondrial-like isoform X1 n=1 Tax=Primulina tabacum TaxID=48773 RepID=UPI003F598C63
MTMQIKKLVDMPSRTGRHLQRYSQGFRLVVGCIPYRIRETNKSAQIHEISVDDLEVLLISSQKSPRMMFPKGGWELDEDIRMAASRETIEEAGVLGLLEVNISPSCRIIGNLDGVYVHEFLCDSKDFLVAIFLQDKLGEWVFKSKSQDKYHEGSMFPLLVTEELDVWPEKDVRRRVWMSVNEAREACSHSWMTDALETFVCQFSARKRMAEEPLMSSRLGSCRVDELRFSRRAQNGDDDVDRCLIS